MKKVLLMFVFINCALFNVAYANDAVEQIKEACDTSTFEVPSENGDFEHLNERSAFVIDVLKNLPSASTAKYGYITKAYPLFWKTIQMCQVKGVVDAGKNKKGTAFMIQTQCEIIVACGILSGFIF